MRRSICVSEPVAARAGEVSTWKFHYTTSITLPKGAKLKFDLLSLGKEVDWETPSVNLKEKRNLIYAITENGDIVGANPVERPDSLVPQYEFSLLTPLKIGQKITIVIGAPHQTKEKERQERGNRCQLSVQRRRPFNLYIDPTGKGNYEDPEVFLLDIRGNKLHIINILTPSFVAKNKRFDITVRFEDQYGNLTNFAPEGTLIDLSYQHLRENLNWKLFVPETGFVILPNLYFNEAGIYKIQLRDLKASTLFTSSPMKCFQESNRNLFWGLLHGESERFDSMHEIESSLRHFRDEKGFNFFATSPNEGSEETSSDVWKVLSQNIADFNEEDRFVTFLGFQYVGESGNEGVRQMLYLKDGKPILRKKESKSNALAKIYKSMTPKDLISIPSFTMGKGFHFDFKSFDPDYECVVEIYNAWGSSECTKKEGNLRPITGKIQENAAGSIVAALKKNLRFGFVAGGLDHQGIYEGLLEQGQVQYSPGCTGILCEKYNRESAAEALQRRSCYATTGPRIIVGFYIAGQPMGSEISTVKKQGLMVNRHISGYVAGTTDLKSIEIIRNGQVLHTFEPDGYHLDYFYDDMVPLNKVVLDGQGKVPFAFYYLRVTQQDGHIAWSSPIWVDLGENTPKAS